jgi:hypothetical protein
MGEVKVVDRGGREIVVFLSGDIDAGMHEDLTAAINEVDSLEHLSLLNRAIVDLKDVTLLEREGVDFLQALHDRGGEHGFQVDLSTVSGPAHRALEASHWPLGIGSVPGASELPMPDGEASQRTVQEGGG